MTVLNVKKLTLALLFASTYMTGAQAATPAALQTFTAPAATTTAKFAGSATINKGANFLSTIPDDQPIGIEGIVIPAAADVGKSGNLYVVANVGTVWAMLTPTGFQLWDSSVATLKPYLSKTLSASESISVSDIEAIAKTDLNGSAINFYLGYSANGSAVLTHSSPITFSVAATNTNTTTCPTGTTKSTTATIATKTTCVLKGTYTANLHLNNNFDYLVSGGVFIGGDNTTSAALTIDAGTTLYGESGADFIRVSRGSKIHVNGAPASPVIMTGAIDATAGLNTTGAWGGLVLNGNSTLNGCTVGTVLCEAEAEGNAGKYGGNNPADNSGNLNYLVVKYAGFEISPGNELNGLTLNSVGSETLIDYVQVHNGSDDGFETFGGTVNAKHLVLTGNDDDNLDWQKGWTGKVQHVLVLTKSVGDRGIEADNNSAARDSLPRSKPKVANVTMIGRATNGNGIKLREGTAGNLFNVVVKGYGTSCVDIDHGPTFLISGTSATSLSGELSIVNSLFDCATPFTPATGDNWDTETWFKAQAGNLVGSSGITTDYRNTATVNARPAADLSSDSFFDKTDYIGAVKDAANDWTLGWTFRPPFTVIGQ
jgi:hypothetical protein